jgi:hypothetical protein
VAGLVNGLSANDVAEKLAEFEGVWEVMLPGEQSHLIRARVDSIEANDISAITLHFHRL